MRKSSCSRNCSACTFISSRRRRRLSDAPSGSHLVADHLVQLLGSMLQVLEQPRPRDVRLTSRSARNFDQKTAEIDSKRLKKPQKAMIFGPKARTGASSFSCSVLSTSSMRGSLSRRFSPPETRVYQGKQWVLSRIFDDFRHFEVVCCQDLPSLMVLEARLASSDLQEPMPAMRVKASRRCE